jgi:hypothetical protein
MGTTMSLHDWIGRHIPDLETSRWDQGRFVTRCVKCDREMIKLSGLGWQLQAGR